MIEALMIFSGINHPFSHTTFDVGVQKSISLVIFISTALIIFNTESFDTQKSIN